MVDFKIDTIYNEDCLIGMQRIPDKSVDCIICDLPYGTTSCEWDVVIPFDKLWEQYERIIKDCGTIVLFGSEPFSSILRCSNLKMYKYDWVWEKNNAGNFQLVNKQPLKVHENISVFYNNPLCFIFSDIIVENIKSKGLSYDDVSSLCLSKNGNKTGWLSNKISGKQIPTRKQWELLCDLFKIDNNYDELCNKIPKHTYNMELNDVNCLCSNANKGGRLNHISSENKRDVYLQSKSGYPKSILKYNRECGLHPTQKPVDLIRFLIRTYSNKGEIILDNCMGSGTTAIACIREERHYIGFELNKEYFDAANERIKDEKAQLRLF